MLEGLALFKGDELKRGEWISSENKEYLLVMENYGNLVLQYSNQIDSVWELQTNGLGSRLAMEYNGDLVLYDKSNNSIWHSKTAGIGGFFYIADDGKFVIVSDSDEEELLSKKAKGKNFIQ